MFYMTLCFTHIQVKILFPRRDKYIQLPECCLKKRKIVECMECSNPRKTFKFVKTCL